MKFFASFDIIFYHLPSLKIAWNQGKQSYFIIYHHLTSFQISLPVRTECVHGTQTSQKAGIPRLFSLFSHVANSPHALIFFDTRNVKFNILFVTF